MNNLTYHFKLALGNSAYAICSKVSVARLNAPQTAQIFIALFLPFGNQIFVCIALFDAILIKLCERKQQVNHFHKQIENKHYQTESHHYTSTDGLSLVEKVENVTAALVMKSEDWPQRLNFTFALMWLGFSCEFKASVNNTVVRGINVRTPRQLINNF